MDTLNIATLVYCDATINVTPDRVEYPLYFPPFPVDWNYPKDVEPDRVEYSTSTLKFHSSIPPLT